MRKEAAQSGDLSLSKGGRKASSAHNPIQKQHAIIAVEPDSDLSQHRRIDQGLIDASREAQNPVLETGGGPKLSWWSGLSATASPPSHTPAGSTSVNFNNTIHTSNPASGAKSGSAAITKHKRTVSYNKVYRA
jgi:hypothetical protein